MNSANTLAVQSWRLPVRESPRYGDCLLIWRCPSVRRSNVPQYRDMSPDMETSIFILDMGKQVTRGKCIQYLTAFETIHLFLENHRSS